MPRPTRTLSVFALALAACNNPTDPGKERVVASIDPSNTHVPVIVAPGEVEAQAPFSVIVHTIGTFACSSPDGQDVSEDGNLVRIVPYDLRAVFGHTQVCPSEGTFHEHRFSVALRNRGLARLRVVGTAMARPDMLDSVEVAVTVR